MDSDTENLPGQVISWISLARSSFFDLRRDIQWLRHSGIVHRASELADSQKSPRLLSDCAHMQGVVSKQANKHALQPSASTNVQRAKAIEDIYQKKSQLEHILLRPDTYIGSTEKKEDKLWVHDGEQLVQQEITHAPGLYKIFDEILVNAADNKVRDPKMDTLKVDISAVGFTVTGIKGVLSLASLAQQPHCCLYSR